jgi:2OG-Fe(II) oxygenase superfamily
MNFIWHSTDVSHLLQTEMGDKWDSEIIGYASEHIHVHKYQANHSTSRENSENKILKAATINGLKILQDIPKLHNLYETQFLDLAAAATGEKVVVANNKIYGINLNIQVGSEMRYECHVDSNPVQGMLYITDHASGEGGELIVANQVNAKSIEDVDQDCIRINPKRGLLIFFDGRNHSHYVSALTRSSSIRVAAAMNFYTADFPESDRPFGLTEHLGL